MFNATFNNISVILWQSVLLVEETGVPGENHRLATSHWQTLFHKVALQFEISDTKDPGVFQINAKFMGVEMDKVDLVFQVSDDIFV
jgi:hypothetical protein